MIIDSHQHGRWHRRDEKGLVGDPRCIELFRTAGLLGCPVVLHLDTP